MARAAMAYPGYGVPQPGPPGGPGGFAAPGPPPGGFVPRDVFLSGVGWLPNFGWFVLGKKMKADICN